MLNSIISFGPFIIPVVWLALFASFFVAIWMIKRDTNRQGLDGNQISEFLWGSVFIGFMIYRLGGAVLDLDSFLRNPVQVLLGAPVPNMSRIGIAVAVTYLLWKLYRANFLRLKNMEILASVMISGFLFGMAIFQFLLTDPGKETTLPWGIHIGNAMYHPINLYRGLLYLILGVLLRWEPFYNHRLGWGLLLIGMLTMFVSLLDISSELWLVMTPEQWLSLGVSLVGWTLLWKKRQIQNSTVV